MPEDRGGGRAPQPDRPVVLTIAGSDSGGGAGIQADLATFHRFGVFGTSAITAVTAQNTLGVSQWHAVAPDLVGAQIIAVAQDLRPRAVKSGMLADASIITAVAEALDEWSLRPYILDPVMVASSGDRLLDPAAVDLVVARLLPLAALVTPNLDEATVLTGRAVTDVASMEGAARALVDYGAAAALVTGGHLEGSEVIDVLYEPVGGVRRYRHPRIDTRDTHGTGCTLSAAITAHLALGHRLADAVAISLDYVHRAIETAPGLGAGHGPVNHWA